MIFVFGGFVILIISFVVALISLIREERSQHDIGRTVQSKPVGVSVTGSITATNQSDHAVTKPEQSEEEIKSARHEEAYRILQSRVNKMTESESDRLSVVVPEPEPDLEPETNIEDKLEGDIALSQKVPLPWKAQTEESDPDLSVTPQVQSVSTLTTLPAEDKNTRFNKKLSGQINISDITKRDE